MDPTFHRDRSTKLDYAMVGTFAYMAVLVGPLMPTMRDRFDLTYAEAGLVPAMLALGVGVSGAFADSVAGRAGDERTIRAAGGSMALAALGLAVPLLLFVYTCLFVVGLGGGTFLSLASSRLARRHGDVQAVAMVEANVVAAVFSLAAPAVLFLLLHLRIGWELALVVPAIVSVPMLMLLDAEVHPSMARLEPRRSPLPTAYWVCWAMLVLVVALETSLNTWGPQYFESVVGLSRSHGAVVPVVFYSGFLLSRIGCAVFARRCTEDKLLLWSFAMTAVGTFVYWAWPSPVPSLAGYVLAGVGVANLWPLSLSLAIRLGKRAGSGPTAATRASLASGCSALVLPPSLGHIADHFGLHASQAGLVCMATAGITLLFIVLWSFSDERLRVDVAEACGRHR